MQYCRKCGRKLDDNAAFCPSCGNRMNKKASTVDSASQTDKERTKSNVKYNQSSVEKTNPNSVQYVYVNKKTGKITNHPNVKTKSEGCFQYVGIALGSIALVILMVSGTVLLTNYLSESSDHTDNDEFWIVSQWEEVSSQEVSSDVSSGSVSSENISSEPDPVSSEQVSSDSSLPENLTAKYMNKKIKGKWETEVPYKNMTLPGVFEFDGKGKAKCTIKAFLFSKKFSGTYEIKDGGTCILTLDGLDEYFEGDTLEGDLRFINDDEMEFTVEETVWKLTRKE